MKTIMLGAPGAGKETQARRVTEKYHTPHISTGDISRANIERDTELGMKAKGFMDQRVLASDGITIGVLTDRIKDADCANEYVLDGFPRTIPQTESLTKTLSAQGKSIDFTVSVNAPDDNIISRMVRHRACLAYGATHHVEFSPPKKEDICDVYGQELVLRDDDRPKTMRKRLDIYHEQTQSLIEYYKQVGVLAEVDGTQDMDDVFSSIMDILGA